MKGLDWVLNGIVIMLVLGVAAFFLSGFFAFKPSDGNFGGGQSGGGGAGSSW